MNNLGAKHRIDKFYLFWTPQKFSSNHHSFMRKSKSNILRNMLPIKLFIVHGKLFFPKLPTSLKKKYFAAMWKGGVDKTSSLGYSDVFWSD